MPGTYSAMADTLRIPPLPNELCSITDVSFYPARASRHSVFRNTFVEIFSLGRKYFIAVQYFKGCESFLLHAIFGYREIEKAVVIESPLLRSGG